jgi:hypothetical protein
MTRCRLLTLLALTGFLTGGCEPPTGTPVVLNERLFSLPSMESAGKGCSTFHLLEEPSDFGPTSGTGGSNVPGLVVSQRSEGNAVLIQVTEGGRVVVERHYRESFFRAGKLDEFIARGASGQAELLRYWGSVASEGTNSCAPFEDDGESAR